MLASQLNIRAQALVYYLVMDRRTHSRDELSTLFWDNMPSTQARKNLRNILPCLRTMLGTYFIITHHTITFNVHTSFWLDVAVFCRLCAPSLDGVATEQLWEAVELYQGDFLQGFGVRHAPQFEEWMLLERERLRAMMIDALTTLAERHTQQHDYQLGLAASRHLLEMEPWNETAHQYQMLLLAQQGRRDLAQTQYTMCCRILESEFTMQPLPETTALYQAIQAGDLHKANAIAMRGKATQTTDISTTPTYSPPVENLPAGDALSPLPAAPITHMGITPDGRLLAESTSCQTITLWNIHTGKVTAILEGHNGTVTALAVGGDGILASGSSDGAILLWDTSTGTLRHRLRGHTGFIATIRFAPTQDMLISGSSNDHTQEVRVWSLQTGKCLSAFNTKV